MDEKPIVLKRTPFTKDRKQWKDGRYFEVRNQAWRCLIENKITALPVDVKGILSSYCILMTYNQAKPIFQNLLDPSLFEESPCFAIFYKGRKIVAYDEDVEMTELNYALAHELGHIFLSHYQNQDLNVEEEAESFATRVLSPLCVINECKVENEEELSYLCEIPLRVAKKRYERLKVLRERNKFLTSELERKVYANFKEFVEGYVEYYHKD